MSKIGCFNRAENAEDVDEGLDYWPWRSGERGEGGGVVLDRIYRMGRIGRRRYPPNGRGGSPLPPAR